MKRYLKPISIVTSSALLLTGVLCQTAHADLVESGTAILADSFGSAEAHPATEDLTVAYTVSLNAGIYTYSYVIQNPTGNQLLSNGDVPNGIPETVDSFNVAFNTTIPGAYITGSATGISEGTPLNPAVQINPNGSGITWTFNTPTTTITAGSSNDVFSFESLLAPVMGNANAADANPPSPWASSPFGTQVTVPGPTAVPDGGLTVALLGGALVLTYGLRRKMA